MVKETKNETELVDSRSQPDDHDRQTYLYMHREEANFTIRVW